MKCKDTDASGELRDLVAIQAMQALLGTHVEATHIWIATQAYKLADVMLDQRDKVSHNEDTK